ncbi:hypothetical protein ACFX15_000075 [Malus domestica]
MIDQTGDFPSPLNPRIIESPSSFEKSGGKVTNEDLQATKMQALRSMKKILETRGREGTVAEAGPYLVLEKGPTLPQFPLLERKRDKGKKKEQAETDNQGEVGDEPQELSLPDLLPPPFVRS